MKLNFNLLYMKTLFVLVGLAACANLMANEVETFVNPQQNIENLTASPTKATFNQQEANWSSKNPNSLLVAMAFKFKNTEGSPRNYAEVVASYCGAARSGDADAQYALGWMYANGRGVPVNEKILLT